ncbi:MAG TPA: hypothetical protein VF136_10215, partial [Methylomirabilota bacterium]
SGTVGWLTLTIVATTFLVFRAADRRLMLALAIGVPVYVLAFYTGNFMFRAISGVALLAIVAWLVYWVWITYLAGERTLPRLAVALGLTSFGYGGVVGVLIQLAYALEIDILPGDTIGAHASAMTFGYLVLCAMGFIEWRLRDTQGLPTLGLVQVGALLLFMYLVFSFISAENPDDPAAFPLNVLIASDHAVYLGVITNVVLGVLSLLFLRGRAPSWMPHVIFWGVNLGLAVFAIGLLVDTAEIKRIGAPVMGVTLLVALGLLAVRAWGATPDTDALEARSA